MNADILLLAHTNIFPPYKDIKLLGYTVYCYNTAQNHSGVAILIRSDIQHNIINKKFEGDTLAIKIETTTGPVIIATNYSPPSRVIFPILDLMWLARHRTPVYFLADLNAHHRSFDTSTNDYGRVLYNMWLEDGYLRRLGPEIGNYISNAGTITKPDIVLSNRHTYHFHYITTLDRNISDHAPISLQISNKAIKIPAPLHEIHKRANWPQFTSIIKNGINPLNFNNNPLIKVDEIINTIETSVNNAQEASIPRNNFRLSIKAHLTPKFHRLQKALTRTYGLMPIFANNPITLRHIRRNKNDLINKIKMEAQSIQNAEWNSLLGELSRERTINPKFFWSKIKPIVSKNPTSKISITSTGTKAGTVLSDPKDIEQKLREECLNKFIPPQMIKLNIYPFRKQTNFILIIQI